MSTLSLSPGVAGRMRAWWRGAGWVDRIFWLGIAWKAVDGVVELIGAAAVLGIGRSLPTLPLIGHLSSSGTIFAAAYLAIHGTVKVVLVVALLREKLWAYPWMIATLVAFVAYQCWEMTQHFSVGLVALTLFDLAMVWLTWVEYGRHRRRAPA